MKHQTPVYPFARLVVGLMILTGCLSADGQLVVNDFSPAHPIKVMYIGDSVTDSCVHSNSWRIYLEQILATNNFPFSAVGRFASPSFPNFTNRLFEAFCGAVIAKPGVTETAFVHNYAGTNVYLNNCIYDALTNAAGSGTNTPNLFCVYIGINDIGRGRDPYLVATNHMPGFLNLLFSNAPNASVILVKTSTFRGTPSHTNLYNSNVTNVFKYGAALQAMVNQHRAQGQRVFLADMYSPLDTNTMFDADREHPNTNGLAVVAREFAARIDAITIRTNRYATTLIYGGSDWKYSDTGQDLGTTWTQLSYDDSLWSHGIGRLGYGDPLGAIVATPVSFGTNAGNKYITTYFRYPFVVPADAGISNLNFRLTCVDGAVVWLNGQEVFRTNLHTSGAVVFNDLALANVTGDLAYKYFPKNLVVPRLTPGTNLVAVEIHKRAASNATLGFDLELLGSGARYPKPELSSTKSNSNVLVSWPVTNTAGYTLYSTTNLDNGGNWSVSPAPFETNAGQIIATVPVDTNTMFFRLQGP